MAENKGKSKGSMIAAIQSAQMAVGSALKGGAAAVAGGDGGSAQTPLLEDLRDIARTNEKNTENVFSILKQMFVFDKDAARRLRDQQAELLKEKGKPGGPSVVQDIKEGKREMGVPKLVGLGAALIALTAFMREINMDAILRLPQQVKSIKGIATFVSGVTKLGTLGLGAKFIDNATDSLKLFKTNFIARLDDLKLLAKNKFASIKFPSFVGLTDEIKKLNFVRHISESKAYKGAVTALRGIKTGIAGILTPLTSAFSSVFGGGATGGPPGAGGGGGALGKILSPLRAIGRIIGKLFLPITLIMGIFDGYTGFMEEYEKEQSFVDGIRGAVTGIVDGFIGGLVRLVTNVIGWMLEKLGLDHMADSIKLFGDNATKAFKDAVGGLVDIVTGIFTLDWERVKGGIIGLTANTADFLFETLTLPLNLMINFVKDIFGWGNPDKPFNLKHFFFGGEGEEGLIPGIWNWFKGLFNFGDVKEKWNALKGKLFNMGKYFKAAVAASAAAVKAGWPGGESPAEAYKRVFEEMTKGGTAADVETDGAEIAKSVVTDVEGNTSETNYKTSTINNAGDFNEGGVTYIDNSAKNVSNISSTKNEQFNGSLFTATDGYWITVDGQQYYVNG